MTSERLFTNADDNRLIQLIQQARRRLVFAAPGISDAVANVLASRIFSTDAPRDLAVILDVDPEVCRLGFGTLEGLERVTAALESRGLRLGTTDGLRVGLIISDDQTLVYSPTPLLIEAGSSAPTKPNAIVLQPNLPEALATACGLGEAIDDPCKQEVGNDYLNPSKLQAVKEDLVHNPPKKFDLARIERVFNYELQFVEFKVEDFSLGRRAISLDPTWLGLNDKELKNRFRNSFRLFESGEGVSVELEDVTPGQHPGSRRKQKVDEETISKLAHELRQDLIPLGVYGTAILKRRRPDFERRVMEFRGFVDRYAEKVRGSLDAEMGRVRDRLLDDLAPDLVKNPPKEWVRRSIHGSVDECRVRELLLEGLQKAFAQVKKEFQPKVTLIFKDVTFTTIVDDPDFRRKLESHFGSADVARLFHEYEAARVVPGGHAT